MPGECRLVACQGATRVDGIGGAVSTVHRWTLARVASVIAAISLLYIGYVRSYLDRETQTTLFIKRYPTFQMEFLDPFENKGDDVLVESLSTVERARFADYCKYRFGMADRSSQTLEKCKAEIPRYLQRSSAPW